MKTKITLLTITAAVAALVGSVSCSVDNNYNFNKIVDNGVTIGDRIPLPLIKDTLYILDVIPFDEILEANPDLDVSSIEELEGMEIEIDVIPALNEIEMSIPIDDGMIGMLTDNGKLFMDIKANSSLQIDVEMTIKLVYPGGYLDAFEDIKVLGNGAIDGEMGETRMELTKETLENVRNATAMEVSFENLDKGTPITFHKDANIAFAISLEKTGGINLDDLTRSGRTE